MGCNRTQSTAKAIANDSGRLHAFRFCVTSGGLFAFTLLAGCRNPGEEGQGQTHTAIAPHNHPSQSPANVATPPTEDRIDPSSPKAVLGGTSATQPTASGLPRR